MDKKFISSKTRRKVFERAKGFCEYCRSDSRFSGSSFEVEHILPESVGGNSELENLALACHGCNLFKSNKTEFFDSATEKTVRLFNPRIDDWTEHFAWSSDFTEMVGLTAIGRATIEALKLNREGLVNKRKMAFKYGEHPPKI
jgi:5-methylcytosine-specific restriction endonuclease McrA